MKPCDAAITSAYRIASERCRQLIRNFEIRREQRVIDGNNAGAFYEFVNRTLACKKGIGTLRDVRGNTVIDDKQRANMLNKYFSSVCTVDDGKKPVFASSVANDAPLSDITFTSAKVACILRKLKASKSAGPDGYPSILFKQLAHVLAVPLSLIYNSFLSVCRMPQAWAHAIVTPVFKSGNAAECNNYRPISLTCIACKIMERIVASEMLRYLRVNNKITKEQHGFLARRSTSTNLLETLNDWTLAIKDKRAVVVAYIDYSKAFDCVSHQKLTIKLSAYGISGNLLKWIEYFLSNRTQQTKVGSQLSDIVSLTSGVVQGSVLGPLLFLLYINDVTRVLAYDGCFCKLYADDMKLYTTLSPTESCVRLQDKLNDLIQWSETWQLKISQSKCAAMYIHETSTNLTPELQLCGSAITKTNEYKDLGVIVDCKLKFASHINNIVSKASTRACLIHKCFLSKDAATLLRAFKVYVRPLLEYASTVWSPSYEISANLIESVQRKFTKRLPGCANLDYASRLATLNLQSLELRRLHFDLITTYKILFGLIDVTVSDFFTFADQDHNTRGHSYKLLGGQCRVNVRQHYFAERVVNVWNSLNVQPNDFKNLQAFKRCILKQDLGDFIVSA